MKIHDKFKEWYIYRDKIGDLWLQNTLLVSKSTKYFHLSKECNRYPEIKHGDKLKKVSVMLT